MIPIWLLKAVLLLDIAAVAGFVAEYWYDTRGRWRSDSIGVTLMAESVLIIAILVPTVLSVFFDLSRLDSELAGWIQVGLLVLVGVVHIWRIVVFRAEARRK